MGEIRVLPRRDKDRKKKEVTKKTKVQKDRKNATWTDGPRRGGSGVRVVARGGTSSAQVARLGWEKLPADATVRRVGGGEAPPGKQ